MLKNRTLQSLILLSKIYKIFKSKHLSLTFFGFILQSLLRRDYCISN